MKFGTHAVLNVACTVEHEKISARLYMNMTCFSVHSSATNTIHNEPQKS